MADDDDDDDDTNQDSPFVNEYLEMDMIWRRMVITMMMMMMI